MPATFDQVLLRYIDHIESLSQTLPIVNLSLELGEKAAHRSLVKFLDKHNYDKVAQDDESRYQFTVENLHEIDKLRRRIEQTRIACRIIPQNFIVSLVSQYDAFLGGLIKAMYYAQPNILNASQKNITYLQLMEFDKIEDAKEYIIEKEIESVLRESHSDQFFWLEKLLKIKLKEGLDIWPQFIEVTERRNLFVHCDGIVSTQYISVCQKHNVELKDIKVGERLEVSESYFNNAYKCFFEIGFKLTQVLWRKLLPNDKDANHSLINTTYDLILHENYHLAIKILNFAITAFSHGMSQDIRLVLVVNLAQAYKWSGEESKLKSLLDTIDWSALDDRFKIARDVLIDDYESALAIMKRIGSEGSIEKSDYKTWALFKKFRENPDFILLYESLFGERLDIAEPPIDLNYQIRESAACSSEGNN